MAAYEHLPIFRAMLDATVFVENMVVHFSRYYKYTLESELRIMCHDALGMIMEANSAHDRYRHLLRLRVILEKIKIHLIIAREVKAFHKPKSFYTIVEKIVAVARQNEGWIKSQSGKARNQGDNQRKPQKR